VREEPGYRPHLAAEEEAEEAVREVYEEARAAFRSTWTPDLFRALGVWPPLLAEAWRQLRPNLLTRFFEESADRLRIKAAEEAAPIAEKELPGAPARSEWRPQEELKRLVGSYHYLYPKALLAAAALGEALRGEEMGMGPVAKEKLAEIPPGAPPEMAQLAPPPEESLEVGARAILGRIRQALAAPHLPAIFCAVARWPHVLQDVWDFLSAARALDAYGPKVAELVQFARRQAHYLPYELDLRPDKVLGMGLRPIEVAAAVGYFERLLAEAVFLAAALEVIFRGHAAARASPFPVPEPRF
jgi:hypothetical protein